MKPIDPSEISTLLDGELSKEREEQVRRAIAEDPVLQREYELLAGLHTEWLAKAREARFCPDVAIPVERNAIPFSLSFFTCMVLILRITAKTVSPIAAWSLELAALVLILTWVLRNLVPACESEPRMIS